MIVVSKNMPSVVQSDTQPNESIYRAKNVACMIISLFMNNIC